MPICFRHGRALTWALPVLAAVLLAACFSSGSSDGSTAGRTAARPNIVVILADDLGYSDLGAFGSEIRTPHIDRLASEGRVLTNFHTTPLCATTRANLLTGADHHLVGLGRMGDINLPYQQGKPGYEGSLNDKARTIAQLLRDAGYHTYMTGKWHLGTDGPSRWGFERSFALAGDLGYANNFVAPPGKGNSADPVFLEDGQDAEVPAGIFSTDLYIDKLIGYIDSQRDDRKPFFAYFAAQAVHWPLQAPDAYLTRYQGVYDAGYADIRSRRLARQRELGIIAADFEENPGAPLGVLNLGLPGPILHRDWSTLLPIERRQEARSMEVFAGMLENLDDNVGRLVAHLKATGRYDNTVIVFLSDNGADGLGFPIPQRGHVDNRLENYGKQASFVFRSSKWGEVGSTPFRLFKGFTAEGGLSVPAIIRIPDAVAAGARSDTLVSSLDLAPTLLALAGIREPGTQYQGRDVAPLEGKSLVPVLRDPAQVIHAPDAVMADELYNHRYVRRGDWKLTRIDAGPGLNGALLNQNWQLFNIADDRGETTVLAERSASTLSLPAFGADSAYEGIVDALLRDWQAYVERVGVALPPLQK